MTDTPVKVIVDLSKPQGEQETIVPLTPEEIADLEAMSAREAERQAAEAAAEAEKAANKESAVAKLSKLGLSEAEIKAIIG